MSRRNWFKGMVVSGGLENTINFYDPSSGLLVHKLPNAHDQYLFCMEFLQNDKLLATGSKDSLIKVWKFQDTAFELEEVGSLGSKEERHTQVVRDLLVLEGSYGKIASSSSDRTIKIWDYNTNKCLHTFTGHTEDVYPIENLKGQPGKLASGSHDFSINLWDVERTVLLRSLKKHKGNVYGLQSSMERGLLFSCSKDKTIKAWDSRSPVEVKTYEHFEELFSILVMDETHEIFVGGRCSGGYIYCWDLRCSSRISWPCHGVGKTLYRMKRIGGKRFATCCSDYTVKVWDAVKRKNINGMVGQQSIYALAFVGDADGLYGKDERSLRHFVDFHVNEIEESEHRLNLMIDRLSDVEVNLKLNTHPDHPKSIKLWKCFVGFFDDGRDKKVIVAKKKHKEMKHALMKKLKEERERKDEKKKKKMKEEEEEDSEDDSDEESEEDEEEDLKAEEEKKDQEAADLQKVNSICIPIDLNMQLNIDQITVTRIVLLCDNTITGMRKQYQYHNKIERLIKIDERNVVDYYMFFQALKMPREMMYLLQWVQRTLTTMEELYDLFRDCASRFEPDLDVFGDGNISKGVPRIKNKKKPRSPKYTVGDIKPFRSKKSPPKENTDPERKSVKFNTALCLHIFNVFKSREKQVKTDTKLLVLLVKLLVPLETFDMVPVMAHPDFHGCQMENLSFTHQLKEMYRTRKSSNLYLTTREGRHNKNIRKGKNAVGILKLSRNTKQPRYMVHRSVICLKSNFFTTMIRFGGQETRSMMNQKVIEMQWLGDRELDHLIQYLYMGRVNPDLADLGVILKLITHCEMYQEDSMLEDLFAQFNIVLKKMMEVEEPLAIDPPKYLPPGYMAEVMDGIPVEEGVVVTHELESVRLPAHRMTEEADENEGEREEGEEEGEEGELENENDVENNNNNNILEEDNFLEELHKKAEEMREMEKKEVEYHPVQVQRMINLLHQYGYMLENPKIAKTIYHYAMKYIPRNKFEAAVSESLKRQRWEENMLCMMDEIDELNKKNHKLRIESKSKKEEAIRWKEELQQEKDRNTKFKMIMLNREKRKREKVLTIRKKLLKSQEGKSQESLVKAILMLTEALGSNEDDLKELSTVL